MEKTLTYISQVLNHSAEVTIHPSWSEVLSVSRKEGLRFLLYKAVIKKNISIPPSIRETFKQEYIYNWGKSARIFEELAALLHTLEIPVIILKGAALLSSVYEDIGLRCLGDVDILARPEDAHRIDKILNQLGYQTSQRPHTYTVSNYLNSQLYGKNGSPLLLHLHWHLVNNALPNYIYAEKINMEKIWKDAIPVMIKQAHALCLAPHHQILHLSEHAMKHSYNTLIHIWDMHQLINHFKKDFNWKRLCEEAEEFHLKGPLFYSLWLGKEYFDACVPQEIMESLRSYRTGLGEKTFSWLLRHGKRKEKLCWLFYLSNISGWQKKIKFILQTIFPPKNILEQMEDVENKNWSNMMRLQVLLRRFQRVLGFFSKE